MKEEKLKSVINASRTLFLEKSIQGVRIDEIARLANVGEATIYRHFKTKQNIALAVALEEWKNILHRLKENLNNKNGFMQIKLFYSMFYDLFIENKKFYSFLDEFDQFVLNNELINPDEYQKVLFEIKEIFNHAYLLGLEDKSIKCIKDIDIFYFTSTHALLSLCKKLANPSLLEQDESLDKSQEISLLIEIILFNLGAKK